VGERFSLMDAETSEWKNKMEPQVVVYHNEGTGDV